ncbi:MAG: hypothetical protein N4A57_09940 [Anaeromicrobium sp.]|uniref:hypothetical protein n=1 Tax=Anaeromicrobium sp. TaxID=1929132 RepID=UPI0025F7E3E5|nr:hypothetical protein [Anaeromicrobium sp.]MCT4594570.1 hypothetical protein [Anaeromicrobium sp.]
MDVIAAYYSSSYFLLSYSATVDFLEAMVAVAKKRIGYFTQFHIHKCPSKNYKISNEKISHMKHFFKGPSFILVFCM